MSARCIAFHVWLALAIALPRISGAVDDTAADDHKNLVEAWTQREKQISSAVFQIHATTFTPKGSLNRRMRHDPSKGDSPSSDTTCQRRIKLYLSGSLRRLEWVGEVINITEGKPEPQDIVLVVQADGEVRELMRYYDNRKLLVDGHVKTKAYQLQELGYLPIFLTCRGLAELPLDGYQIGRGNTDAAAGECMTLTRRDGVTRQYWIDAARGYSVVRYKSHSSAGRGRRTQLDIEYAPDKTVGWVPKRWKTTTYVDKTNSLARRLECEVVSYELNRPLSSDLFTLSFPAGARVYDLRNPDEEVCYEILPSGQRKEISRRPLQNACSATCRPKADSGAKP